MPDYIFRSNSAPFATFSCNFNLQENATTPAFWADLIFEDGRTWATFAWPTINKDSYQAILWLLDSNGCPEEYMEELSTILKLGIPA